MNRWLASALGKVGWAFIPQDMLYVVGGWTYGGFEAENFNGQTFRMQGPTIGAGLEAQIGWGWTLKAEYRYTRFESKDANFTTSFVSSVPGSISTSSNNNTATIHAQMQTFLVGASHYFTTY